LYFKRNYKPFITSFAVGWCWLQKNKICSRITKLYINKSGVLEGKLREGKLKKLKCDFQRQQQKQMKQNFKSIFIISSEVAKKSKLLPIGKECMYNEGKSRDALSREATPF
jgi:hypothetical protein